MEFPSYHHHNRYAPPPPPNNFLDDHRNLFLPPPPPPPPYALPPPPPPPVPPPPQSYNPHFTFLDPQNPSFLTNSRSPPRFSNHFHHRTDSWPDPRTHRHHRLYSPNSTSENYYQPNVSDRLIPNSNNRYRDDTIIDGYANRDISSNIVTQEQPVFNNIDRYAPVHSVMDVDKATGSGSRNLGDFVEKYEPHYVTERTWGGDEETRWILPNKGKKNEGVSSRKQSRDYEYDSNKFNRVREGREEFKQVQKKSVLLRIGKPNNTSWNRNHDQHISKSHVIESSNSNFRGTTDKDRDHKTKDPILYSDQRVEGDRERSPVELDVSFKSGGLVAKAVVTPCSPVFDNNGTQPRNRKVKRAIESDSPSTKFSDRSASSFTRPDCPSSSEKAPKKLKDKDSSTSLASSGAVDDSLRNGSTSGLVSDHGGGNGGFKGPLSFRLRKKRKLVNLASTASSFQISEKEDKPIKVENIKNSSSARTLLFPPLEKLISSKVVVEKDENLSNDPSLDDINNIGDDLIENNTLASQKVNDGLVKDPSEKEVSPKVENDAQKVSTDVNLSLGGTDISASSGQVQECPTESHVNDLCNISAKSQEITTSADIDICSDKMAIENLDEEIPTNTNEGISIETKVKEIIPEHCIAGETSKFPETETPNANVFAKGNAILSSGSNVFAKGNAILSSGSSQIPGGKHENVVHEEILSAKDGVGEMVKLMTSPEYCEPSTDDNHLFPKDDLQPSLVSDLKDKSFVSDSMPDMLNNNIVSTEHVSSLTGKSTISNLKSDCEKSVSSLLYSTKPLVENSKTPIITRKLQESNLPTTSVSAVPRVLTNSKNIAKPRTWHRSASNSVPKNMGIGQNSYVRSGNTLVRKGSLTSTSASRISVETRNGGSVLRPKTPPLLSSTTKLPDCPTIPVPMNAETAFPVAVQKDQNSNSESQKTLEQVKKIKYVKRKSNQLVASDLSSDGYYKRRKNQLIRTSVGVDSANTDVDKSSKTNVKRQSGKGIYKKYKHLRFPSVWTLGSQSLGNNGVPLLRPHLFPWKRSRIWGNVASLPNNNSSSSSISSKLLLSRKRDMIYTRSKHGFSLRMSKLLSVGGSGLKWSKSIERNSKRANEEATLAVAAAEKKRREQHGTAEIKSRKYVSSKSIQRDRIFRIGLFRYKMDPSRRTLQRILGEEEPSTSIQSNEEIKRSYVPKRLLIGQDEYLRIGNGNQLVRNPKRRTRVFANEKVRWSLHTARSRLAKKKKYCQFYTRFGKCNKDDGKCPFIHDSSKIAVCTKFLNGSCSNPDCKLTHKVIPERMQDCLYFSQGLCSNQHCPYRHVNVNSAASICEGFLKGYCADGNECRKKHTYACPVFEATGECSEGRKCKLHHPRNRNIQWKQMEQKKTSRGRYFGSNKDGEAINNISHKKKKKKKQLKEEENDLYQQGKFAEFISLDYSSQEEEEEEEEEATSKPLLLDLDAEVTKPIGIMKKISSSECDLGT